MVLRRTDRDTGVLASAQRTWPPVPFAFMRALDQGRVAPGDNVLLCGTAAGLTANALALRL